MIMKAGLPKCGALPGLVRIGYGVRLRSAHASSITISLAYPWMQCLRGFFLALEIKKSVQRAVKLGHPTLESIFFIGAQISAIVRASIIIGVAVSLLGRAMWGALLTKIGLLRGCLTLLLHVGYEQTNNYFLVHGKSKLVFS